MIRTLSEILIDADNSKDIQSLINLWNELAENKKKYTIVQLNFAREHFSKLSLNVNGQDIDKGKFYLHLNNKQ